MHNKKLLATVPPPAPAPEANPEGDVQVKVESPKPMMPSETATPGKEVPVSPVNNAEK